MCECFDEVLLCQMAYYCCTDLDNAMEVLFWHTLKCVHSTDKEFFFPQFFSLFLGDCPRNYLYSRTWTHTLEDIFHYEQCYNTQSVGSKFSLPHKCFVKSKIVLRFQYFPLSIRDSVLFIATRTGPLFLCYQQLDGSTLGLLKMYYCDMQFF